ncbi:MAG: DNA polymerase I [Hyphomicrobiales bacterium]
MTADTAPDPSSRGETVYLIDGSGFIFRAYHALPPLTRKSDGLPIGAVQGFCAMLNKLLRETNAASRPTHLAVIFDKSERSFRNAIYPEYKAHRPPAPADLIPQFPLVREAVKAFNVPCLEQGGFEADDLIATYATIARERGATVKIVSSDKDLMQLVGDRVRMIDAMKDKEFGIGEVMEKFGVPPSKLIDVQALAGDSVDNVPGVPGIGVKTAAQLVNEYGDLEAILANAHQIKQQKRRENLIEHAEAARLSKRLVTLRCDVPLDVPLDDLKVRNPDADALIGFLKGLELTTLTRRVASELGVDAGGISATGVAEGKGPGPAAPAAAAAPDEAVTGDSLKPMAPPRAAFGPYPTLSSLDQVEALVRLVRDQGHVALYPVLRTGDALRTDILGLALAVAPGQAAYIPTVHRTSAELDFGADSNAFLPWASVLETLKPVLQDRGILKIGHDIKRAALFLSRFGIRLDPVEDTMLQSYVLDAGLRGHELETLAALLPGHESALLGSRKERAGMDKLPADVAATLAATSADVILRLSMVLKHRLTVEHKVTVYEKLERPLVSVLADLEREGVLIDRTVLARLSQELGTKASALEQEIHALAGGAFNIGSPKQLGDVLFGKLQLDSGKKTSTGARSTDSDVLEELAAQGIEIAQKVLDWRQLTKLKSTYTDSLPLYMNPDTGRVHTSFSLAATSTGRLASTDPNLQNIPVRTDEGRKIRSAFIAAPGRTLISADYSQIELRVLAHVADIPQLRQAFVDGADIHAITASEMFGLPVEGMDPMVRRRAKAINFGIIYGISAFGLANQLGISREEAGEYIRTYFKRFPGIRDYMESVKAFVKEHRYVENVFGRRLHFPRITAPNPSERAFQERAAINAPIQGAAADIIRRAMIRLPAALEKAGLSAKMLLQVHDELIFEAPVEQAEAVMDVAKQVMERAPEPAVRFKVPIRVDARAASNWEEAH